MNYNRPELRDRLASEYVLGTLHGRARTRFQQLLKDDPKLRAAVAFWERELVPMAAPLSVPAPSAKLWAGIARQISPRERDAPLSWFERWFNTRTFGSLAAGLFIGIGVALVAPLNEDTEPGTTKAQLPESYAGFLQDASGTPAMLVSSRRYGKVVDIKVLRPIAIRPDQVLQLWALPKDAPPLALGTVPALGKGKIELPATSEQLLSEVSELAVSVTSKGEAPSAQPLGPFILRGPCTKFW